MTGKSLPEIGRSFGKRDHTTVLHAVKKIQISLKNDIELREDLRILKKKLNYEYR